MNVEKVWMEYRMHRFNLERDKEPKMFIHVMRQNTDEDWNEAWKTSRR